MSQAQTHAHWNPLIDTAHGAVREYANEGKVGATAMGPRIGKPSHVLSNELNGAYPGAKLGLETAYFIDNELPRPAILYKYAQMLNHVCFPLPDATIPCGDIELLTKFAEWQSAMGKTCQSIHAALEDGRITKQEADTIISTGYAHMRKFMEFIERVKELAE